MTDEQREIVRQAMSVLGKQTSERKKISSRKNASRPRKRKRISKQIALTVPNGEKQ